MSKQARIQKEPNRLMVNSPKLSLKIKLPNILQLLKDDSFKARLFFKNSMVSTVHALNELRRSH